MAMFSNTTAVYILMAIVGVCVMTALGAFLGKRLTVNTLARYTGIIALVAIVCCVIFIAWATLSNHDSATELTKTSIIVLGIVLACCAFLALGGYLGKKVEVFRVVITCGIIILLAFIIFLIYIAVLAITGQL